MVQCRLFKTKLSILADSAALHQTACYLPFQINSMENILNLIKAERERQNEKWGEQNYPVIEWQAILMKEVGEAAKEATDFHFKNPVKNFEGEMVAPANGDQALRLSRYRKELIQVAAVAVQIIECLDRNGR